MTVIINEMLKKTKQSNTTQLAQKQLAALDGTWNP